MLPRRRFAAALWPGCGHLPQSRTYAFPTGRVDEVNLPEARLFLSLGRQTSQRLVAQARSLLDAAMLGTGHPDQFCSSVSRAGKFQVVALASGKLGIDIETRERVALNVRRDDPWLSPADRRYLRHKNVDGIGELASRWVLREAYGKALGVGLALTLDALTFVRSATGELRLHHGPEICKDWRFSLFQNNELIVGIARARNIIHFPQVQLVTLNQCIDHSNSLIHS